MLFKKSFFSILLFGFACGPFDLVANVSQASALTNPVQAEGVWVLHEQVISKMVVELIKNQFGLNEKGLIKVINSAQLLCSQKGYRERDKNFDKKLIIQIVTKAFNDAQLLADIIKKCAEFKGSTKHHSNFFEYFDGESYYLVYGSEEIVKELYKNNQLIYDFEKKVNYFPIELSTPNEDQRKVIIISALIENGKFIASSLLDEVVKVTNGLESTDIMDLINRMISMIYIEQIRAKDCLRFFEKKFSHRNYMDRADYFRGLLRDELFLKKCKGEAYMTDPELSDVFGYKKQINIVLKLLQKRNKGNCQEVGVVFSGPSGLGKTFLAKAVGKKEGYEVIVIHTPDIMSKGTLGSGVREILEILKDAINRVTRGEKIIIFFDEIDKLVASDKNNLHEEYDAALAKLWLMHDSCRSLAGIAIMGATNDYKALDKRITQRMCELEFSYPDATVRKGIMERSIERKGVIISAKLLNEFVSDKKTGRWSGRGLVLMIEDAINGLGENKPLQEGETVTKDRMQASWDKWKNMKDVEDSWWQRNIVTSFKEKPNELFAQMGVLGIAVAAGSKGVEWLVELYKNGKLEGISELAYNVIINDKTGVVVVTGASFATGTVVGGFVGKKASEFLATTPEEGAVVGGIAGSSTGALTSYATMEFVTWAVCPKCAVAVKFAALLGALGGGYEGAKEGYDVQVEKARC